MDRIAKGQDKALNRIATIYSNETSKKKGYFPSGKKFKRPDIIKLFKNYKVIVPTLYSLLRAPAIIRKHKTSTKYKNDISQADYETLRNLILNELQMDNFGVAKLSSIDVFKGEGIPFEHVIVLTKHMDKDMFKPKDLPSMDCQIEVMKVYGETGVAANKVTTFLRKLGYAAAPNHSLGGNIDYTKAAMNANLGFIGKHGMLITPHAGSCNRISVIYTSISNLDQFLDNSNDHSWGYEFCKKCKKCVRECPYDAIYNENIIDEYGHVESISNDLCNAGFLEYGCGLCIGVCPFTTVGYDKLHRTHVKKRGEQNAN